MGRATHTPVRQPWPVPTYARMSPPQTAEFIALLGMINLPSARLRLQQFLPEIEQLDGVDYNTFTFYLMEVCTTESLQHHNTDEAAIAIATLFKNIRTDARNNRAQLRANSTGKSKGSSRRIKAKPRIARVASKKSLKESTKPLETTDSDSSAYTGVHAFMDGTEEANESRLDEWTDRCFFVNQVHIPILLILAWILFGTLGYVYLQQWTVGQSFYFMIQAIPTLSQLLARVTPIRLTLGDPPLHVAVQAGLSVGFGAFSEDFFRSQHMPPCVVGACVCLYVLWWFVVYFLSRVVA